MYPEWLEQWWTEKALGYYGAESLADCSVRLERAIRRLSDLFTKDRAAGFGDYGEETELLLAYGLFFFPQAFVRTGIPLTEAIALHGWKPPSNRPTRLLDLGSGMGGATLGAMECFRQNGSPGCEAMAVDRSVNSLEILRELTRTATRHFPGSTVQTGLGDLRSWFEEDNPDQPWDFILAGFSLGEAFFGESAKSLSHWLRSAFQHLSNHGLILIMEPALKETSERLAALRDWVAAETEWFIWAPCLHHRPCPLLAEGTHWCHEVKRRPTPASLSFLNRHLHRSIHDLKYSFLLLAKQPPPRQREAVAPEQVARLVSPVRKGKGGWHWTGCATDGVKRVYEIQKRDVGSTVQTLLKEIERGEILQTGAIRPVADGAIHRIIAGQPLGKWSPAPGKRMVKDGSP